jgi:hypothetical protein
MSYNEILLNIFYQVPNIAVATSLIFFYSRTVKIENLLATNLILFFNLISVFFINNASFALQLPDQIKYINSINTISNNLSQFDIHEKLSPDILFFSKIISLFPFAYQTKELFFLSLINKLLQSIILVHMFSKKIINYKIFLFILLIPSLFISTALALREMLVIFIIYFTIYNLASKKYFYFFFFIILLFYIKKPFLIIIFIVLTFYSLFFSLKQFSKFYYLKNKLTIFRAIAVAFISTFSVIIIYFNYDFLIAVSNDARIKNNITSLKSSDLSEFKLTYYAILYFDSVKNILYIPGAQNFKTAIYFFDYIYLFSLTCFICNYCNLNFSKKIFYFTVSFVLMTLTYQLIINHGTFFRWRLVIFSLIILMILIFEKQNKIV